jgi:GT2 family glycosyltransferase
VIVVDNNSSDRTPAVLMRYRDRLRVLWNLENLGFAGGQNQAIRASRGDWVLVLNPDTLLRPDFISRLVEAGNLEPTVGTLCGKLLRAAPPLEIPPEQQIDSAGIYFTPTFRHFDRGLHQMDRGQYDSPAYVFGATGAAAFYRRAMIEDVSVEGQFFDEDFFFSREDADVSWRAQLQGWKCLYVPGAVGHHVRRVFPKARRKLPDAINLHSVKNRFLMRIKNVTTPLYLRHLPAVTARDLGIALYCLFKERGSLRAFPYVLRNWRRALAKRRVIQGRRKVTGSYLQQWFRFQPVAILAGTTIRKETEHAGAGQPARPSVPIPSTSAEPGGLQ